MDTYLIENDYLKAKFINQGGELIELFDKSTQTHRLKVGTQFWSYYSPVLFPIIGRSFEDTIRFQGKTFTMEKHGFLRKSLMNVLEHEPDQIIFQFISNPETLKIYPFEFQILLSYTLIDSSLEVSHKIINKGKEVLPFQIGGHPAFNLHAFQSIQLEEHYIQFSAQEENIRHLINSEGYFTGETESVPIQNQKLFLSDKFFEKDAIIFKNIESGVISLKNLKNHHGIHVEIFETENSESFHLGIWKPVGADFVCIEPWVGCADNIHFQEDFTNKELIRKIEPNQSDEFVYSIEVF